MRLKIPALIVWLVALCFVALIAAGIAHAQQSGKSVPPSPPWNDNSLIAVQKTGGDPGRSGDVKIAFYGHDAFKITSPGGLTVLSDPWRNDATGHYPKWFLNEFPAVRVDIVLSTHAHFDHDAVERPNGLMVLERLVGHFKLGDLEITGLADKHQCAPGCTPDNAIGLDNAIQIIKTGGLRIAIWGDNRASPDPSIDRYLKNVDVLILPIESVLTPAEADAIIGKYDPKSVIPAHYFVAGLTAEGSGVESSDGWVNDREKGHRADVRRLDHAELTLNTAELKGSHHRIYYFGNHFQKD